jgi:hypothetical protein
MSDYNIRKGTWDNLFRRPGGKKAEAKEPKPGDKPSLAEQINWNNMYRDKKRGK